MSAQPDCPVCLKVLERVCYEGGYLNKDQFDSVRAGDWFCDNTSIVDHGSHAKRSRSGFAYFWNRELVR